MLESKINQAIHDCEFRLKIIQVRIDRGYGNKETEEMKENVLLEIEALRALEKSMLIKEMLGNDYDLDRLRELVQADREGRVNILPSPRENTCGKCGNFTRTPGCGYGECTLRPGLRPYQSRAKCKRYTEKALEEMEDNRNVRA